MFLNLVTPQPPARARFPEVPTSRGSVLISWKWKGGSEGVEWGVFRKSPIGVLISWKRKGGSDGRSPRARTAARARLRASSQEGR